jgi:phosphatidylglycerol lysyltransferase
VVQLDPKSWVRITDRTPGAARRWFVAALLAAITLGSGIFNLFSVMGGPTHPGWLVDVFPFEFIHLSRTLTLLAGFALIISSLNIYRRKRRAWAVVIALSCCSIVFHIARGFHYGIALFSLALAILLVTQRAVFTVKSSPPDVGSGVLRLVIAAGVAIGYGVLGFWLLAQRHFGINFHIFNAVEMTWRVLTLQEPWLSPLTQYGRWFLDSLQIMGVVAVVYAGFALFRPVLYEYRVRPRERAQARQLIDQYGRSSLDYFKQWPDKSFFFSVSQRCFIAYSVAGNVALALGDPIGPEDEIGPTTGSYLQMCRDNGWTAALHQTLPDYLRMYQRLRMKKLKIGDVAIINLKDFSLEGKSRKEFRYKVRQLESMGLHTVVHEAPVPDSVIAKLKAVSDEWLRIPGRRERRFTLGFFDTEYLRSTPIVTVEGPEEHIFGFVNLIFLESQKEISIDLMRRRTEAPNGVMDYLFVKVFLHAKERGYDRFDLGMAPMAGFQDREDATPEERAIHRFFQQLNFLFSFQGLRQYKAKFASSWEPRYLVYRNALDLPRIAIALKRLSEVKEHELE